MAGESKMLVTGAGGFIGSHLVEALLRQGHAVRAFVRYNSAGRRGWLDEVRPSLPAQLETFFGDVTDARAVHEAMAGCSRVYHLAALIGIPYSYVAPASYVAVNVTGTLNVLEAARAHGLERVVVTSTSEVYGTALYAPIDEEHPLQGQSPYSATKIGADHLALSYHRAFGLPVTVVRPFNTYGPRQSTRAVIPTVITQALFGDAIHIGSRDPVRDMVYVEDTAAGFLALADSPACVGRVTNLATGVGVTVGELIDQILALVGRRPPVIEAEERKRPEASEVFKLLGSAERARERAGWTPATPLAEGLARTIAWFREHFDPAQGRPGEYRV
jgi:NAD dependent epimerase/dehydratase